MALGFDIWEIIMTGYTTPTNPPTYADEKNPSENNAKSMNFILCGLSEFEFVKVMHSESKKEIWDKIQNVYEGDDMVRKEKLQNHRR
jgi:hypothetical protein